MIAHLAFPAITLAAIAAEIERELEQRRGFYPGRVTKGNMLQAEADRELALAAAWREDVARIAALWGAAPGDPIRAQVAAGDSAQKAVNGLPEPSHSFTWRERREGLRRELEMRERFYPGWIAGGRLLAGQAAHRTACLAALLAIYEDGWDWRAGDGCLPGESDLATREFRQLRAEVDAREGRSQKELELA